MAISSASTLSEIEGQYLDNVDWAGTGSLASARAFAAAIRALLVKKPNSQQFATASIRYDMALLQRQLAEVSEFIRTHPDAPGGASTTYLSQERFR